MTEVTIIIPNYNGKKLLENCIKTLERQTCQEFKLLVIDNGSKDGSTDVTSESLYMEMVALPENTGFCGAVNLGFEMTTTPYAILLNNDTEAEPHFVEELLQGIRQSERIFSCGAQMLDFKQRELLDNAGQERPRSLMQSRLRCTGKPVVMCAKRICSAANMQKMT